MKRAILIAGTLLFLLGAGQAKASIVTATYDLTVGNTSGGGGIANNSTVTSPYEQIVMTGDTTAGTVQFAITIPANDAGATIHEFGFNITSLLSGLATSNFTGISPNDFSATVDANQQLDGFGKFDVILATSSASVREPSLSFTISGINALVGDSNWTLTSDTGSSEILFAAPSDGHLFASDYFPATGATGFVDGPVFVPGGPDPNVITPQPNSAVLLGLGAFGLIAFRLRRRSSALA